MQLSGGLINTKTLSQLQYAVISLFNTLKLVKYHTTLFLLITPIMSIYGIATTKFVLSTWIFTLVCYALGLIGITTCYHRLYSHRTFKVARPVELFLLFWATTDFSMSAINWVKDHRAHHKYTDTEKDPYNSKRGFWWAHAGWLLWKRERPCSDVSDLEHDPVLIIQHKLFAVWAFLFGWGIPTLFCGYFWGDYRGGFYIASVFKTVVLHHCIFCINSLAHYSGDTPFSDTTTPRENVLCAVLTMGEGYHNFHHEFPNDYRNGVQITAYDPTKWFIATLEYLGLAHDLKRTDMDHVQLSKIQMIQKKIDEQKKVIFLGKPVSELPYYTREQVADLCCKGEQLVIEGDMVFDVHEFAPKHPGGYQYVKNNLGKDITSAYSGAVYAHSNAARNLLQTLRCGRLVEQKKDV